MAVAELYIADEIRSRLPEKALAEVAAHLHKRDCQTCGKPLGDKAPALTVDDGGPFLSAMLHHQSCRPSGWYQLGSLVAGAHLSWTSRFFTLPMDDDGALDPRATFIVCPHLEAVHLDQDGGDGWTVNTGRHWRARGFRPMGRELVVDKWVADQTPPRARLTGSTIQIDAGLDGQWSSSADLETIKACRTHNGLLLGVSTAFEPVAATGPNDVLYYGTAGHIFLGWVPLT
ncbi:hypothetical protein OOK36_54495 [Streptomyces sp. NBC_00365]|uniref:hypothetical protein n=1 Tax=Streptomyces sp. NBC_00365 TaxID=2975726 RepID=UPI002258F0A8|nr:hypothetical protein [Streptomyces sp. NBC_00365]MCX5097485.1 hypothetical protein [Streptomyces sp. NBC_00365]